jgi:hypothetical protein
MLWGLLTTLTGLIILAIGLARLRNPRVNGFRVSNSNISFGGNVKQKIEGQGATPTNLNKHRFDWVGLIIAVLGLLTSLLGLFEALAKYGHTS